MASGFRLQVHTQRANKSDTDYGVNLPSKTSGAGSTRSHSSSVRRVPSACSMVHALHLGQNLRLGTVELVRLPANTAMQHDLIIRSLVCFIYCLESPRA
jgi:hypothetical protein